MPDQRPALPDLDMPGSGGVAIERGGHRCLLKWHRGRRRAGDPAFTAARIREGLALGASLEIDLLRHAGGGFAVLHDDDLHPATTGRGPVAEAEPAALRGLRLRDPDGRPSAHPVLLLEDLAALVADGPCHTQALLQLDMKTAAPEMTPADVAGFARAVAPVARHMILSSAHAASVERLSEAVPNLPLGFDPCHGGNRERTEASGDFAGFVAGALRASPKATTIYLHHELVLFAERAGFDLVGAFRAQDRLVDAYTITLATPDNLRKVERLLALKVDQITTDDPEGLEALLRAAA